MVMNLIPMNQIIPIMISVIPKMERLIKMYSATLIKKKLAALMTLTLRNLIVLIQETLMLMYLTGYLLYPCLILLPV